MIMSRQPPPQQNSSIGKIAIKNFADLGLVMKSISKKIPQHSHVNNLLHTAATGNGVLEDLDGLLTPIRINTMTRRPDSSPPPQQQQESGGSSMSKERTERNLWRNDEVLEMMYVMQEIKALDKLNDKQTKSENVFKDVEVIMHKNGFVKKSHLQIWTKWKFLKSTYMTSRRNGIVPRIIPRGIYNQLHQMISGAMECDTSTNGSVCDDTPLAHSDGGSYISNDPKATDLLSRSEDNDNLDVAHPIFGFRLGLVKNEPLDNGYENNDSTADNNLLEEIAAPKAPPKQLTPEKTPEKPIEQPIIVVPPPRGRGRPPKKLPWPTPTATSTPASSSVGLNTKLSPLRVAPFAKASNTANALSTSRPTPPPLIIPPTPQPIRVANICSLNDNNKAEIRPLRLIQPKLVPKPQPRYSHPQSVQVLRMPKDVCAQTGRASSSPSASYPKLKQIPVRKTPYSLRPDRAIPDLDASISPPSSPEKPRKLEEVPSTSHLVMQTNEVHENGISSKRRLDQPLPTQSIPTKLRKIALPKDERPQTVHNDRVCTDERMYEKLMQTAIVDMTSSLRKTQTQMIKEFFDKQHGLLEKEHAFQMQQDRLILETFQMQTQEIMNSVRELVATLATHKIQQPRRYNSRNITIKQPRDKQKRQTTEEAIYFNEESSSQAIQEQQPKQHQYNHINNQAATDIDQEIVENFTDEEELDAEVVDNISEGIANIEKDINHLFESNPEKWAERNESDHQASSKLSQRQAQAEENIEEENNEDNDDDDDDEDSDEKSDSDDEDDENVSFHILNENDDEQEHILPNTARE